MSNREKYKFDDFTLGNYKRLIDLAKDRGFEFILHKDDFIADRKDVIWRHDVEFSPDIALKMAEIEKEAGVQATYFWQLHSDYYNTVSHYFTRLLKKIKSLGHHIGLHFDCHYYNIKSETQLDKYIIRDKEFLEDALGDDIVIDTFSFHNTNAFVLNCKAYRYGSLINVYSSYFQEHYSYCADSTGIWRYDRLEDVLNNDNVQHLQVLTHDGMWSEHVMSPHKRILTCIQSEADRQKWSYVLQLPKTGNINVDDDEINPQRINL